MTKVVVREIEYETVDNQESIVFSLKFMWLFIELVDNELFKKAEEEKIPMRVILEDVITKAQQNIDAYFGDLISSLCRKGQAEEVGGYLRSLLPDLPESDDPLFLTETCFAYITALAKEGADKASSASQSTPAPQPEKKPRKKKGGFGDKPEVPTLEAIAGREVTPEELAATKIEGKPLEEAIATPLIPISDEELVKLRPDLPTLEEQELQAALREQESYHLNIVSKSVPLDTDELEGLT